MADTHGFEVVIEARESVLKKALQGAWKSADCPDVPPNTPPELGRIPEFMDIAPGTPFPPYVVEAGHIQLPENELDAIMAPEVNGAELKFGLKVQVQIQNPPIPTAALWDMTCDVRAKVPVGSVPGSLDVGMLLGDLLPGNVSAVLTSGDPVLPQLDALLADFAHKAWENGAPNTTPDPNFPIIQHRILGSTSNAVLGTANTVTDIFDDQSDPQRHISARRTGVAPNEIVEISLPIHVKIYNIQNANNNAANGIWTPMGVETHLIIKAPFTSVPGTYTIDFSQATTDTDPVLTPVSGPPVGSAVEGTNYSHNNTVLVSFLDGFLKTEIKNRGLTMAQAFGARTMHAPKVADIEATIRDRFYNDLKNRGFLMLWSPSAGGTAVNATNVAVKALTDALVIAINAAGGADVNAMTNFVPGDREFAIALDGAKVQQVFDQTRNDNGFANSNFPKRMQSDGHDVDLNALNVFLTSGAIRMTGSVTVIDALPCIDVDADFTVDVGLNWDPNAALNAAGGQLMKETVLSQDVDPEESVLFWVIAAILTILTFGTGSVLVVIIAAVIAVVILAMVEKIGGEKLVDGVTGALAGIKAWPPKLARIGRVEAVFHDPISIEPNGLVLAGTLQVLSSCELVTRKAALSGGAYTVKAGVPVVLTAGATASTAAYRWLPGDGAPEAAVQNLPHVYVASGVYVARHTLAIQESGGSTSRHFARITVENVPPVVDAGPDITVNEGEVVTLVGRFTDIEYPDRHESMWDFGDNQPPQPGVIVETNTPPRAAGASTVTHAWCDNGEYTVMLRVTDQNGGIGASTRKVTVLNVPPVVDAGPPMYSYHCSALTLTATFTDPGWCDTHTGTWDFGDCGGPQTATIRETHKPPAGTGVVIATHCYERCGTYHAVCTVLDDDGGVGEAFTVVRVIDVNNKDFEGGYRRLRVGTVANAWWPYTAQKVPADTFADLVHAHANVPGENETPGSAKGGMPASSDGTIFFCEECIVHGGQRSQRLRVGDPARAGIRQQVGANAGWDYQVSAWYVIDERGGGVARLGIDPAGGANPDAATVVWTAGIEQRHWAQLVVRAQAVASKITIFLEAQTFSAIAGGRAAANVASANDAPAEVCFDSVALLAVQPFCPAEQPLKPPQPSRVCVDFADMTTQDKLPAVFVRKGFQFTMLNKQPAQIVTFGPPPGAAKLLLGRGVLMELPFTAGAVHVRVAASHSVITLVAIAANGTVLGQAVTDPAGLPVQELSVVSPGIAQVQVSGRNPDATLIEICAEGVVKHPGMPADPRPQNPALPDAGIRSIRAVG
jgi:hypothetical protein